jgi:hypothetical protein
LRTAIDAGRLLRHGRGVPDLGRWLIVVGLVAVLAGAALLWGPRVPWLGRLPGDLVFRRGPVTVYLPIATSILISVVLSVLVYLFRRR